MKIIGDILPVLTKHTLTFVESKHESADVWTFLFKSDKPYSWKPGQHGLFIIPGKRLEGGSFRGFSLASIPSESIIRITTRISSKPSAFKQALLNLQQGESIYMRGPFGPFYLEAPARPAVCIAGGIGITPYRAIISDAAQKLNNGGPIRVLYIDSKNTFVYRDCLDGLAASNSSITIEYLTDKDELAKEINRSVEAFNNNAVYLLSGPPAMVKQLKERLLGLGIKKSNIKHEMFLGL